MFNHHIPQKRDVIDYVLASEDSISFAVSIVMFLDLFLTSFLTLRSIVS